MGKDYCTNYLLLHKNITANLVVYNTHLLSQFQGVGTPAWVDWLLSKAVVKVLVRARRRWGRIHFPAQWAGCACYSLQFLVMVGLKVPVSCCFGWRLFLATWPSYSMPTCFFFFSEKDNTFTTCFFKASKGTLSLCKTDVKILCNVIICRYSCTFHHFCHILMVKSKPWVPLPTLIWSVEGLCLGVYAKRYRGHRGHVRVCLP